MSKSFDENTDLLGYRAKWVFPVDRPPIENGIVICSGNSVHSVEPFNGQQCSGNVIDLGDVAIIPGMVNAHTHLEFSDLTQPLGDPKAGFTNWMRTLNSHQQSTTALSDSHKHASIQAGIAESLAAGVVAIGEIATDTWSDLAYASDLCGVVFHEQRGNNPLEAFSKTNEVSAAVNQFDVPGWTSAVSPHAPYSTALTLFQALVSRAAKSKTRVAIHLAETLEEVEFIETGAGPFANMLNEMGISFQRSAGAINVGDYLKTLAQTEALIIHGNYLNVEELEFIAQHENLHLVFCPRTHSYFGHKEYPLRTMLDLKINVAVGTESRASNPDLNLFAELQQIAATQPSVSPTEILRMGTESGAKVLNLQKRFGTIATGKYINLCKISNPQRINKEQDLFHSNSVCIPLNSHPREV